MQAYSDPKRKNDPHALPDVEVFSVTELEIIDMDWRDGDGDYLPAGWYYWFCFPGCLPDSDPVGPFDSEREALDDAQENALDVED